MSINYFVVTLFRLTASNLTKNNLERSVNIKIKILFFNLYDVMKTVVVTKILLRSSWNFNLSSSQPKGSKIEFLFLTHVSNEAARKNEWIFNWASLNSVFILIINLIKIHQNQKLIQLTDCVRATSPTTNAGTCSMGLISLNSAECWN